MSYEKAMKHTRNVRKVKKQARQYMGFDTGYRSQTKYSERTYALIELRRWFRERNCGDKSYNRECIREKLSDIRGMVTANG